jgi:hypothetical protein
MSAPSIALAAATDPTPRIQVSREGLVHMEDTSPQPIGTPGGLPPPNVVAAPTRSMWQTDSVSIKVVLRVSWGLRAAGGLAWTSAVTW